jgi:diguanylate cyclase (GGDEF)-like protein
MQTVMDRVRAPAPASELADAAEPRVAVREALLTPLQLIPLALVPVFVFARSRGWVADVPLWVLVGSVFVAQWASNLAHALWPAGCRAPQMVVRVGVMVCGIALAMYSTGWGPVFAFGYVFAAAENIRVDGSRVARPVIAWMVGATAVAQIGIAIGWIPSLVPQPEVQGVAVLAVLGSALVILLLRWSTAGKERFERDLTHLTMHDALTGLPNQRMLRDRLEQALERGRHSGLRVGVLFLDLDRFKNVNDTRGHEVGDALLIEVAGRLEMAIRDEDTIARFGGDEFSVLCEGLSAEQAEASVRATAERLRETFAQPFVVGDTEVLVGASIGVAIGGEDGRVDDLLRDADTAMYKAKSAGLGRIEVFDDALRRSVLQLASTEHALRVAIEQEELRLYFQPIVSLETGRCVGAEALVRWQHRERGIVGPAEFIEIAEESGLILPLGSWVLGEAVRAVRRWSSETPEGFVVSVNVSPRQLEQEGFGQDLRNLLSVHGVDPRMLCLEITESALTAQSDHTLAMIREVKALGCSLSIDDFGTGYSSLSQLKWLPVNAVKIDGSFVGGLGSNQKDTAIVAAVVGLARALDLAAIAEGVETSEQIAELAAMGCDLAQGYWFARPRPAHDYTDLVQGLASLSNVEAAR